MAEDSILISTIAAYCTIVLLYEGMASANGKLDSMVNPWDRLWPVHL